MAMMMMMMMMMMMDDDDDEGRRNVAVLIAALVTLIPDTLITLVTLGVCSNHYSIGLSDSLLNQLFCNNTPLYKNS